MKAFSDYKGHYQQIKMVCVFTSFYHQSSEGTLITLYKIDMGENELEKNNMCGCHNISLQLEFR